MYLPVFLFCFGDLQYDLFFDSLTGTGSVMSCQLSDPNSSLLHSVCRERLEDRETSNARNMAQDIPMEEDQKMGSNRGSHQLHHLVSTHFTSG